jgi:TRAP transporter TAXI family solute receptor
MFSAPVWSLDEPVDITFGAMPIGSSWYVWAATISGLLEEALPSGSKVEVLPQGGGIANPLILSQGKAEVGFVNVATGRWAYDGIMMYQDRSAKNLRALTGGIGKVWIIPMLSESFIQKTGIDSLEELVKQQYPIRVVTKPNSSVAPWIGDLLLGEYGTSFETIKKWGGKHIQISGGQIPSLMREGRADLWIETVLRGHPATVEGTTTSDLRMLSLPQNVRENLSKYGLFEDTMPPKFFRLQENAIETVSPGIVIATTEELPEELAYLITKTICESKEELVKASAAWKVYDPETSWIPAKTGIPLHPGAERYFREQGWK